MPNNENAIDLYWKLKLAPKSILGDLGASKRTDGRCDYHVPPFSLTELTLPDGRIEGRCTKCGGFIGYRWPTLPSATERKSKGKRK